MMSSVPNYYAGYSNYSSPRYVDANGQEVLDPSVAPASVSLAPPQQDTFTPQQAPVVVEAPPAPEKKGISATTAGLIALGTAVIAGGVGWALKKPQAAEAVIDNVNTFSKSHVEDLQKQLKEAMENAPEVSKARIKDLESQLEKAKASVGGASKAVASGLDDLNLETATPKQIAEAIRKQHLLEDREGMEALRNARLNGLKTEDNVYQTTFGKHSKKNEATLDELKVALGDSAKGVDRVMISPKNPELDAIIDSTLPSDKRRIAEGRWVIEKYVGVNKTAVVKYVPGELYTPEQKSLLDLYKRLGGMKEGITSAERRDIIKKVNDVGKGLNTPTEFTYDSASGIILKHTPSGSSTSVSMHVPVLSPSKLLNPTEFAKYHVVNQDGTPIPYTTFEQWSKKATDDDKEIWAKLKLSVVAPGKPSISGSEPIIKIDTGEATTTHSVDFEF